MTPSETPALDWLTDKVGRHYIVRPEGHGSGNIWRHGDEETVEQAILRDREQIALRTRARETKQQADRDAREAERPRGKGRPPDPTPPPKPTSPPRPGPTGEQLAASIEIVLGSGGALWGRYVLGCDYCAGSLRDTAPAAARDLVKLAEKNAPLKALLVRWHTLISTLMVGQGFEGLILWAGRPIVHHAVPEPMSSIISPILGVPARQATAPHTHAPPPPPSEPQSQPEPAAASSNGAPPVDAATLQAEQAAMAERTAAAERELQRVRLMEQAAAEQAARRGQTPEPNFPPYSAQERAERAPGPQAPPIPDGATDAGSPLPPEA